MRTRLGRCCWCILAIFLCTVFGETQTLAAGKGDGGTIDLIDNGANTPSLFTFDYGAPASPALSLLGLSGSKTKASTELKPFALSLPNLVQADSSAALDIAPAWAFGQSRSISPADYAASYLDQLWFKTRVGFAIYRGDDGDGDTTKQKPSRAATSLSFSLLPYSDPLTVMQAGSSKTVWDACLDKDKDKLSRAYVYRFNSLDAQALASEPGTLATDAAGGVASLSAPQQAQLKADLAKEEALYLKVIGSPGSGASETDLAKKLVADQKDLLTFITQKPDDEKQADAKLSSLLADCQKEASTAAEHGADLQLVLGVVESGLPGKLENFGKPNFAAWFGGRLPLGDRSDPNDCGDKDARSFWNQLASCWLIGASTHYSDHETDATGDKSVPQAVFNTVEGWGGLEQVNARWTLGAYAGYTDQQSVDPAFAKYSKSGVRWLVNAGVALNFVGQGVWLVGSYGTASGSTTALDDRIFTLTIDLSPPAVSSLFAPSGG